MRKTPNRGADARSYAEANEGERARKEVGVGVGLIVTAGGALSGTRLQQHRCPAMIWEPDVVRRSCTALGTSAERVDRPHYGGAEPMLSFFPLNGILRLLGLTDVPAIPINESVPELAKALARLLIRTEQVA